LKSNKKHPLKPHEHQTFPEVKLISLQKLAARVGPIKHPRLKRKGRTTNQDDPPLI
jgi:hypothetical protein